MDEQAWVRWLLQTSRSWEDVEEIVKKTGIPEVDQDHKILVNYAIDLNNVISRISNNEFEVKDFDEELKLLERFYHYAVDHFQREEKFILRNRIDGLDTQKTQHSKILKSIESTINAFKLGRVVATPSLKLELLDWIVEHINHIDYVTFSPANYKRGILSAYHWDDIKNLFKQTGLHFIDYGYRNIISSLFLFCEKANTFSLKDAIVEYDDLIEKLVLFFKEENAFIDKFELPLSLEQKRAHKDFIDYVLSIRRKIVTHNDLEIQDVKFEFISWVVNHLIDIDSKSLSVENWKENIFNQTRSSEDVLWMIYRTGEEIVDKRHIEIFTLCFDLFSLSEREHKDSELLDKFNELVQLVKTHFSEEENILSHSEYDQLESHIMEHQHFLEWLESIRGPVESHTFVFNQEMKVKLLEWWVCHTNYIDNKAFHFIQESSI